MKKRDRLAKDKRRGRGKTVPRKITVICQWCADTFEPSGLGALADFCSAKCYEASLAAEENANAEA